MNAKNCGTSSLWVETWWPADATFSSFSEVMVLSVMSQKDSLDWNRWENPGSGGAHSGELLRKAFGGGAEVDGSGTDGEMLSLFGYFLDRHLDAKHKSLGDFDDQRLIPTTGPIP